VRELRNLIESMVVLSPGREIGPADIPREIRAPHETSRLLPVPVSRPPGEEEEGRGHGDEPRRFRPELEFVFRTLVDLRMDMDQLRREFDLYRDDIDERFVAPEGTRIRLPTPGGEIELGVWAGGGPEDGVAPPAEVGLSEAPRVFEEGTPAERVLYRPGMTIEEMEAEAIRLVLEEVGGNRRMAAESLGIGERTLYRKIRKYGIDA
jgi:DNA-binding NtrC family response regulator